MRSNAPMRLVVGRLWGASTDINSLSTPGRDSVSYCVSVDRVSRSFLIGRPIMRDLFHSPRAPLRTRVVASSAIAALLVAAGAIGGTLVCRPAVLLGLRLSTRQIFNQRRSPHSQMS